jgi:ABC-type glycerol-3-phosphate transport system permease component
LFEAASADGATTLQQFTMVVLPLARPALGTVAALGFVWAWGDLFVALILLQDPSKYTQTVAAAGLATVFNANVQETAAAALLSMLPLVIIFSLAQRAIVRGFTAGVGK